jgi:hypothetical protein
VNGIQSRWVVLLLIVMILLAAVIMPRLIQGRQYQKLLQNTLDGNSPVISSEPTLIEPDFPQPTQSRTPSPVEIEDTPDPATPTPTSKPDCTHTARYWVDHLDYWPDHFVMGNFEYYREEAIKIYQMTSVDVSIRLFIQFNTAYLNILYGADPTAIKYTFDEASSWLDYQTIGNSMPGPISQRGLELTKLLEDFNNGIRGPGACPGVSTLEPDQSTGFFVPAFTVTPATSTPTQVFTPTQTPTEVKVFYTSVPPTKTPKPTRRAPRPATAAPTKSSPPTAAPTVPKPPTREPPPTPPPP